MNYSSAVDIFMAFTVTIFTKHQKKYLFGKKVSQAPNYEYKGSTIC
jgi:hypothetical protein